MENKTADGLFENLHYMCIDKEAKDYLDYHITCEEDGVYYNQDIIFDLEKEVVYVKTDNFRYPPELGELEIRAIQLKMEELGW